MNKIRGLLIVPGIEPICYDFNSTVGDYTVIIGSQPTFIRLDENSAIYCASAGLNGVLPKNRIFRNDEISGNFIIVGTSGYNDCSLMLYQIHDYTLKFCLKDSGIFSAADNIDLCNYVTKRKEAYYYELATKRD